VQLLGRQLEHEAPAEALVALPPEPGLPFLFEATLPRAQYVHLDYAVYRSDRDLLGGVPGGVEPIFALDWESVRPASWAVIFLPKEKELAEWVMTGLAARLRPGAQVRVVGENRAGIRSVKPLIEAAVGPVHGNRSGRHAVLWEAVRADVLPPPRDLRRAFAFEVGGETLRAVSYPGVFSHGEFDPGTRFLLDALGRPPFERALDWGCGAGVIGAYLLRLRPQSFVDLVDSHSLALRSARETLEANGFPSDRVYATDGFTEVRGTFDLIVANPPFHAGTKTRLSVTERMIRDSARHLLPGGRLVLVANTFLGYPAVLRECYRKLRILAETTRFRVFEATND
jgi:16S rRNA (guanine1207-N2)-methyltransferase